MTMNPIQPTDNKTSCDHPANDLIEAAAFGYAMDAEQQLVAEHLASCAVCTEAMADARLAAAALPLSVEEMDVPESVWAGIEQRIGTQPEPVPAPLVSPAKASTPFKVHWAAAAVLALLTLAAGIVLGRSVFETAPNTSSTDVAFTDPQMQATGSVKYEPGQGVILLELQDMPAPPEGEVYQVWMIEGESPVSMGVFDPSSARFAMAGNPEDFDVLAITLEPGPTGSEQPTSAPLAVAELAPLVDD